MHDQYLFHWLVSKSSLFLGERFDFSQSQRIIQLILAMARVGTSSVEIATKIGFQSYFAIVIISDTGLFVVHLLSVSLGALSQQRKYSL